MDNLYQKIQYGSVIESLSEDYDGIRVMGDVHGQYEPFEEVLEEAIIENKFPIQLGDLLDRGDKSYECLATALWLREQGYGDFISGNHEYKHYRYMLTPELEIKPHHINTIRQLEKLTDEELFLFLEFMQQKNYILKWGNVRMSHAAYHPIFEKDVNLTKKELRLATQYAIYGPHMKMIKKNPNNRFSWIEDIPKDIVCIVGHTRFEEITLVENSEGGKVYFIDIGCERRVPPKVGYLDIFRDGRIETTCEVRKIELESLYE